MLQVLIDHKASTDIQDEEGQTPLVIASAAGQLEFARVSRTRRLGSSL